MTVAEDDDTLVARGNLAEDACSGEGDEEGGASLNCYILYVPPRILFPAKLKLFEKNGKVRVFNNPQDAAQGLLEYGVNMESPAGEPDLESTLQASGWQTHRSRNRRTPGCELMSDVKTLIDSLDRHERAKE
ncbi:hypothetical protein JOQ06_008202 [Pogonophryne albipinna]|uniref:Uncharacterized protein n=1 Tax=Pogonophryne albipinna TaxID=1090488 RepID=A0AAD6AJU0_9TELE|nr:hypothetical protein JOQ06_008202 [Pogonophryne albipinna]